MSTGRPDPPDPREISQIADLVQCSINSTLAAIRERRSSERSELAFTLVLLRTAECLNSIRVLAERGCGSDAVELLETILENGIDLECIRSDVKHAVEYVRYRGFDLVKWTASGVVQSASDVTCDSGGRRTAPQCDGLSWWNKSLLERADRWGWGHGYETLTAIRGRAARRIDSCEDEDRENGVIIRKPDPRVSVEALFCASVFVTTILERVCTALNIPRPVHLGEAILRIDAEVAVGVDTGESQTVVEHEEGSRQKGQIELRTWEDFMNASVGVPLDDRGIALGMHLCYENARCLVEEASLLKRNGYSGRAFSLGVLALEELAKVPLLCETMYFKQDDKRQWRKFWEQFQSHKTKQMVWGYYGDLRDADYAYQNIVSSGSVGYLERLKQMGLYVGMFDGNWFLPNSYWKANDHLVNWILAVASERVSDFAHIHGSLELSQRFLKRVRAEHEAFGIPQTRDEARELLRRLETLGMEKVNETIENLVHDQIPPKSG